MTNSKLKPIEFNKLMAYFLEKNGVEKKIRSCSFGYRTYDNSWKLLKGKMQIVHHKTVKCFEYGEYVSKLEETVYFIKQTVDSISVTFAYKKLI